MSFVLGKKKKRAINLEEEELPCSQRPKVDALAPLAAAPFSQKGSAVPTV